MKNKSKFYDEYDLSAEDQKRLAQSFETMVQTGDISKPLDGDGDGEIDGNWLTEDAVDGELASLINSQLEADGEDGFFTSGKVVSDFHEAMNEAIETLDTDKHSYSFNQTQVSTKVETTEAGNVSFTERKEVTETTVTVSDAPELRGLFVSMDYRRNLCNISDGIQFMTFSTESLQSLPNEQAILIEEAALIENIIRAGIANLYPTAQFTREELTSQVSSIIDDCNTLKFLITSSEFDDKLYNGFYVLPTINEELGAIIEHFKKKDMGISFATEFYRATLGGGYGNNTRMLLHDEDNLSDLYQDALLSDGDTSYKNIPDSVDDGGWIPFVYDIKRILTNINSCDEFVWLMEGDDDHDPEREGNNYPDDDTDYDEDENEEDENIDIFKDDEEECEDEAKIEVEVKETRTSRITIPLSNANAEDYKISPDSSK